MPLDPTPTPPRLSVVLLTWNEEANVGACLDALARQTSRDFEVIALDAASTDKTPQILAAAVPTFPVPLRVEGSARRTSVGEARNRGVALARAPAVAFLSADAVPRADWVARALRGLDRADLVYGRQVHDPSAPNLAAAVRGLRYHHFDRRAKPDPVTLASHVSAAIRIEPLRAFPFGTDVAGSAVDDLLLARRAARAGWRVAYDPELVVHHRDVASPGAEWRKNVREGLGWGTHARELGLHHAVLAWGCMLGIAGAALASAPGPLPAALLAGALWFPAVRRAWRTRSAALPLRGIAVGIAASPAFDLAFLAAYARGLLAGATARLRTHTGEDVA